MKIINYIPVIFALLLFAACENVLDQEVDFEVEVTSSTPLQTTDSGFVAPVGTTLNFDFLGEPDFISFHYSRFIPTNSTLKFSSQAAWGTNIANTMSVFLSDSFTGLSMSDFVKDSIAVLTHNWINISDQCNLPVAANQIRPAAVNLNEYRGKEMVIAFRYKPTFAGDWQPTWVISNLNIENTMITDNSVVSNYIASSLGFTPFDVLNRATAYNNEPIAGVWSTVNPLAMEIRRTARDNKLNEDWLISQRILIPIGQTEVSPVAGLKNTTKSVTEHSHTFNAIGHYTLYFKAANTNYRHHSSVVRTVKVTITNP